MLRFVFFKREYIVMKRPNCFLVWTTAAFLITATPVFAEDSPVDADAYMKKAYNFSAWTKGRFSEMITVTTPGKLITIAGIGAESEEDGKTLYPGDMLGQFRYAFMKIKKALATQGATLANVTRMVTFLTDMGGGVRETAKPYLEYTTCRKEAFEGVVVLPKRTGIVLVRAVAAV